MLFSIPRGWKPHLPGQLHPLVGSVSNRAVIERNNKPHLPGLEKLELPNYLFNLHLDCCSIIPQTNSLRYSIYSQSNALISSLTAKNTSSIQAKETLS